MSFKFTESISLLKSRALNALGQVKLCQSSLSSHINYNAYCGGIVLGRIIDNENSYYFACTVTESNESSATIPSHQLSNYNLSKSKYNIELSNENLALAEEVRMIPLSKTDWDIVSTQSSLIEYVFLEQYTLVYNGQLLRVVLSPSLHVDFRVESIKASDHCDYAKTNELTKLIVNPYISDSLNCSNLKSYWSQIASKYLSLRLLPIQYNIPSCGHFQTDYNDELFQLVGEVFQQNFSPKCTQDSLLQDRDEIVAYVNPNDVLKLAPTNVSTISNFAFIRNSYSDQMNIGPWTDTTIVPLKLSLQIKYGHIHLDSRTRRILGAENYSRMDVRIIDASKLPIRMPSEILLQPVSYSDNNNNVLKDPESDKGNVPCITQNNVDLCLSRYLGSFNTSIPFIDNSIISGPRGIDFLVTLNYNPIRSEGTSNEQIATGITIPNVVNFDHDAFTFNLDSNLFKLGPNQVLVPVSSTCWLESLNNSAKSSIELYSQVSENKSNIFSAKTMREVFGDTISPITTEIKSLLDKKSAFSRVLHNVPPQTGALLTGDDRTGKSSIIKSINTEFQNCNIYPVHLAQIDCKVMKVKSTQKIVMELKEIFINAWKKAPSIIFFDDLDALCASFDASQDVEYSSRHDKIGLVSMQLERLLYETSYRNSRSHTLAIEKLQSLFNLESLKMHEDSSYNIYRDEIVDDVTAISQSNLVYILATAKSPSKIQNRLLSSYGLRKFYSIQSLNASKRYSLLDYFVGLLSKDMVLPAVNDNSLHLASLEFFYTFSQATEGFLIGDMCNFARSIVAEILGSNIKTNASKKYQISWQNILTPLKTYIPITSFINGGNESMLSSVGWKDIKGMDSIKQILKDTLLYPIFFNRLYNLSPIKFSRGILLFGPPGVGKTLLAHSLAKECGLNFVSVKGPELLSKYIGASEKAVRDLFENALKSGKSTIIFFDEFEALASKRGKDATGVTDRVVNQFLTLLDGVEELMVMGEIHSNSGAEISQNSYGKQPRIFILAATSRPDLIDSALLRPGRIERHVYVGLPSVEERIDILTSLLKMNSSDQKELDDNVVSAVHRICQSAATSQFTGADLRALVNSAYLYAVHEEIDAIQKGQIPNSIVGIFPEHLDKALLVTKPSILPSDMAQLSQLYSRFRNLPTENVNDSNSNQSILDKYNDLAPNERLKEYNQRATLK